MIAQNRNENFVPEFFFCGQPVDIEVRSITAGRAVFEHIPPIAVMPSRDCHVIGNNIEHLAEVAFAETLAEAGMSFFTAQFLIYAMVIDDIIAMRAARSCLQVGRAIDVAYTEKLEIIGDGSSLVKVEVFVQLKAVGSDGDS